MEHQQEALTSATDRRELVQRASAMLRAGPIGLRRAVEVDEQSTGRPPVRSEEPPEPNGV